MWCQILSSNGFYLVRAGIRIIRPGHRPWPSPCRCSYTENMITTIFSWWNSMCYQLCEICPHLPSVFVNHHKSYQANSIITLGLVTRWGIQTSLTAGKSNPHPDPSCRCGCRYKLYIMSNIEIFILEIWILFAINDRYWVSHSKNSFSVIFCQPGAISTFILCPSRRLWWWTEWW